MSRARHPFLIGTVLVITFASYGNCASWTYHSAHDGPDNWYKYAELCGTGKRQSPIDVRATSTARTLSSFLFSAGVSRQTPLTLTHSGHSVYAKALEGRTHEITMSAPGILPGPLYRFVNVHWHWGDSVANDQGSEHAIEGRKFPLEMHIVWARADMTPASYMKHPHGLAVTSFMYQVGSQNITTGFNSVVPALSRTPSPNDTHQFDLSLMSLMPHDLRQFYRYSGGLTTPKCNQIVEWTVFSQPGVITATNLNHFYNLYLNGDERMLNTFRPLQPLNGRNVIKYSFGGNDGDGSYSVFSLDDQLTSSASTHTYSGMLVALLASYHGYQASQNRL